jgi:P-aminobenzoate N-oxygenase AurF
MPATEVHRQPGYSYADCLEKSYRINWKISDVLGAREFDRSRRWLPSALSGADGVTCLSEEEKVKLTHVEMAAYSHIFGYVEEFIAPLMSTRALDFKIDRREGYDALTNFAAEEVKHMNLFREIRSKVNGAIGLPLALLDKEKEVAWFVLSKNQGGVLLLTACIEYFTQLHYTTAFKDNESLDPLTKHIFKSHWLEESQHARMDNLETFRAFSSMTKAEKDQAIADLIELVGAVDGLLQKQSANDVENLEKYVNRKFSEADYREIYDSVLRAKRYTFILSGVTHPGFLELFGAVTTPEQQDRVQKSLQPLVQAVSKS